MTFKRYVFGFEVKISFNIGLITCSSQRNKCFEVIVPISVTDCQQGVGYVSSFGRVGLRVL